MTADGQDPDAGETAAGRPDAAWRRLVRGFATLVAGEGAARAFGLVAVLVLARTLGPGGFGVVAVGTAIVAWYGIMVDNATQVSSTPEISRRPGAFHSIVGPVLGLRLAVAVVGVVIVVIGSLELARAPLNAEAYALFSLAFLAAAPNMRWMVLGVNGARELAIANAFGQLVFLVLVLAFIGNEDDLLRVPVVYAIGELGFTVALAVLIGRRLGYVWPSIDLAVWRETIHRGFPLLVGAASRGALLSFDLLLIAVVLGPSSAGYYGAAVKPVLLFGTITGLFSLSFLASYSASGEGGRWLFRRALVSASILSVLCAAALSLLSGVFVDLVYGASFAPAAAVVAILAWRIPSMALASVYGSALIATGLQRWVMVSNLAGAALNIVGVVVAVQWFGIEAVALVSVLAALVIAAINHHAAVTHGAAPRVRNLLARSRLPVTPRG